MSISPSCLRRRRALFCALAFAFALCVGFLRAVAQDSGKLDFHGQLHDHINIPVPDGGITSIVAAPDFEFTDEQYEQIESYLDIPEGESAEFYQKRLEVLRASRSGLVERWYRQRAAQLVERIDAALETADSRFVDALTQERQALFERYNSLVRAGDAEALLALIHEHDVRAYNVLDYGKTPTKWSPAPNSLLSQMYEAYYRLRIQEVGSAGDVDALKAVVSELVESENALVSSISQNLVEYVALYDCNQASAFAQALDDAKARTAQKRGFNSNRNSSTEPPLIAIDSPAVKAMKKLYTVPEDRDLDFYRQLLKSYLDAPPEASYDSDFRDLREQALATTLRHIILLSKDSDERISPSLLERYRALVFERCDYPAVVELQELGFLNPNDHMLYFNKLRHVCEVYFARLIAKGEYVNSSRRREIIHEFAEAAEKQDVVFQVYTNFFGHEVNYRTSTFAKDLRAAICAAGLKSNRPQPYYSALRLSETPEPSGDSFIGRKVDLRGVDVNHKAFDITSCEGKPILLVFGMNAQDLSHQFSSLSSSPLGAKFDRGEVTLVGYLVKPRSTLPPSQRDSKPPYDLIKSLPELQNASYPILSEYFSSVSNAENGADYPMLGDELSFKHCLYLLLDADGTILVAYNSTNDRNGESIWQLDQYLDNLAAQRSER